MKCRNIYITVILLLLSQHIYAQLFSRPDSLSRRKPSLFPLPALGYSQEKGLEFGAYLLYSFYTDRHLPDTGTRNSTVNLGTTFTTEKQFKVDLKTDIWTRGNKYHYKGNLRYHNFPIYFYGIGDKTLDSNRTLLDNTRYKVQLEAERRVGGHFYVGFSLLFQHDAYSAKKDKGIYPQADLVDKDGGYVTFLGVTGIFDNRDNQNYTRKGTWLKANIAYAPSFLSKHALWRFEGQGTQFFSISPKSTIGLNGYLQSVQGDQVPFYLLPEMGNDLLMRGYYTGRYRDRNYLAGQVEYRYFIDPKIPIKIWFVDMQPKFALAGFAGTGAVFNNHNFGIDRFKPNYGLGIRWFYDEHAKLTIRLDYGWGEKRPGEKRQSGFYLSLAEAF
ncbi:hypothetical protein KTO58_09565 [Chitinophaga pendula]|uniref:polymerase n=1 Tax=Chitinophaga TaxID=79328 RepID=UPI000BAE9887|nr:MULTISPECIES: polymerase [Chitinophaga]ASZ12957.1 polymerase [Chitinophaga sp. MD30]UCJ09411.1 hypothetical protein KTO58_09565 [Chitinophaga pendula]